MEKYTKAVKANIHYDRDYSGKGGLGTFSVDFYDEDHVYVGSQYGITSEENAKHFLVENYPNIKVESLVH